MIVKACLSLLAGLYALQLSSFPFAFDAIPGLLVAASGLALSARTRLAGIALAGVALYAGAVQDVVAGRLDPHYAGDSIVTRVTVADFPRANGLNVGFLALPVDDRRLPGRLRLTWFSPPVELRPGDTWQFEIRLRRPRATANPGGRDGEAWFTRERIGAVGYVVDGPRNHLLSSGPAGVLTALRLRFAARVGRVVADSGHAAVLAAIVAGVRNGISAEQWERFSRTGTSHLMAISGLHVGLAATAGYALARLAGLLLPVRGNAHRFALVASMAVAAGYAFVSGLAVPAQRAGLMIGLAGLAMLFGRRPAPLRIVGAAAIVLVLVDPLATMAPGFKLSFGAVAVLLWQARRYGPGTGVRQRFRQLLASQFLLLAGLGPIVITEFGRIALAAPVANLVAVPLFGVTTVPLALAGLVLDGPLAVIGDACLRAAARSLEVLDMFLGRVAGSGWAAIPIADAGGSPWLLLPMLLMLAWPCLPPGWPGRAAAWIALAAVIGFRPPALPAACIRASVLDVGQGLAVVVETRSHALVYDTGPAYRSGGDSALSIVLPYLASRGIRHVDRLVISHGDNDHAGGAASLVAGTDVASLWYGEPLRVAAQHPAPCVAGGEWRWDGAVFRMLHPPQAGSFSGNDRSCVLRIAVGSLALLLPGDIERAAEIALLAREPPGRVTAVVVPHHGSLTSSATAFVEHLDARYAIVSAGYRNRWGLPKPAVVRRWQNAGAVVLNTADSGAVVVRLCAENRAVQVREQRRERRRIWHE